MDERKRRATEFYERISGSYDHRMVTLMQLSTRLAEALVQRAAIFEGARVLDVGTGTGSVALAAARCVGAQGRVIGVDLSSGMLAQTRRKAGNLPVDFRVMDAETLEFADATFDVVLSGLTLWFLPDVVRGMKKIRRVLRPGGRVAFSTYTRETFQPLRDLMWARLEQRGARRFPTIRSSASWSELLDELSAEALEGLESEVVEDVEKLRTPDGIRVDTSALIGIGVRRQ